jgi:CheY-like chemotaxis protein
VVGEAADGHEAVELASRLAPDLILMDLSMPVMDGVDATREIAGLADPPAVLLFTAWADRERIAEAVAAGAAGHVLKDAPPGVLLAALESARAGPRPRLVEVPALDAGAPGDAGRGNVVPIGGRTRGRRWPVRLTAGVAAVVMLGITGAAAASEGRLPPPIQAAARFVGLPTPEQVGPDDARHDLARLDAALRSGDSNEIAAAADRLRGRLGTLSSSDQTRLGVATALDRAQQRLAPVGSPSPNVGPAAPAAPAPAPAPPATIDHRGPGGGGGDENGTTSGGRGPGPASTTTVPAVASPATTTPDTSGRGGQGGGGRGDGGSRGGPSTTSPSGGGAHA